MANSWTDDVDDSSDDDEEEEQADDQPFPEAFEEAVEDGSASDLGELELVQNIEEVDNEDALREAWLQLDGEKRNIVENRIEDLDGSVPGDDEDESEDESESDDSGGSGWGGDDSEEDDSSEAPQPSAESLDEMEEESPGEDEGSAESDSSRSSGSSGGPPVPGNAMSPGEAAEKDRRWKIMVWGPPKLFKTHFCYTMPEPVAFLDLEGKADDIAQKFSDKEVMIWQPQDMEAEPDTKFRRAKKALDEALEWLEYYREEEGQIGSIVVDSMSLMWEWAQIHHKLENYPLKDEEEIELSSNFNSSQESDWAVIKEYHNGEFRERITDSPYHFCWTAMERVDFEQKFDEGENAQIMEPTGEPKNEYKADSLIHARKDEDRGKVGDLTGSNFTDNVFVGLQKPTFAKVRDAIEAIQAAEASPDSVDRADLADEIGAEAVINYDPQTYNA